MSGWFWLPLTVSNCPIWKNPTRQWIRFLINSYLSTKLRVQGHYRTATQKRDSSFTAMCTASTTRTSDKPVSARSYQNRLHRPIAQNLHLALRLRGQLTTWKDLEAQTQQKLFQGRSIRMKPYQTSSKSHTPSSALRQFTTSLTQLQSIPFIVHLRQSMQKTSAYYTIPSPISLKRPSTRNPSQGGFHRSLSGTAKQSPKDFGAALVTN